MKAAAIFLVLVIAMALVGITVYEVARYGTDISTAASGAPQQLGNAVVDGFAWSIQNKAWSVFVLVCLVAMCIVWNPKIKSR